MTTPPPTRRRPPPRPVEVVAVKQLTTRLLSVHLGGPALEGFAIEAPTSHVKVLLPPPGRELVLPTPGPAGPIWPEGDDRPIVRTYTPRRFDSASGTLEVQFVLHGEGAASQWAANAKPGDQIAITGPGGRFRLNPSASPWWIAGDESAIPAIATLLEALPASAKGEVHIEIDSLKDQFPLIGSSAVTIRWHQRRPGDWGGELKSVAATAQVEPGTHFWIATEAGAVRDIRRTLLQRGVPRDVLTTRGYWRLGESNHPDGDYGED